MALIVKLNRAKKHLRIDNSAEDESIREYILAAGEWVADYTGRILTPPAVRTDSYPPFGARRAPLQLKHRDTEAVTQVQYYDENDMLQTLATTKYRLVTPSGNRYQQLIPSLNEEWVTVDTTRPDAVQVTANVGTPATEMPERYKHAVLLLVGEWYENRMAAGKAPMAVENLLARDRPFQ